MKFEVGDLVQNYIGDLLITVAGGFEDAATTEWERGVIGAPTSGKACKLQYATFHRYDGQEYTIWAHHANWKQHKVVTNRKIKK